MIGQGSPQQCGALEASCLRGPNYQLEPSSSLAQCQWAAAQVLRLVGLAVMVLVLHQPLSAVQLNPAAESTTAVRRTTPVRVRIQWGGERPQKWSGQIHLSNGSVRDWRPLGVNATAAVSAVIQDQRLRIVPIEAVAFQGMDLELDTEATGFLFLELRNESSGQPFNHTIAISELLRAGVRLPIDRQNVISLQRSPGDQIRIRWADDHRALKTRKIFAPQIEVRDPSIESDTDYACRYTLVDVASGVEAWSQSLVSRSDQRGEFPSFRSPSFKLPDEEGVYLFRVEVRSKRAFSSTRLVRDVELLVLDEQRPATRSGQSFQKIRDVALLETGGAIDPLRPFAGVERAGNQKLEPLASGWSALGVGGWEALQIELPAADRLYEIRIPYDPSRAMAVGAGVLQPDQLGKFQELGSETGWVVDPDFSVIEPNNQARVGSTIATHRLRFWANSRRVVLALVNRDTRNTAVLGQVELWQAETNETETDEAEIGSVDPPNSELFPKFSEVGSVVLRQFSDMQDRVKPAKALPEEAASVAANTHLADQSGLAEPENEVSSSNHWNSPKRGSFAFYERPFFVDEFQAGPGPGTEEPARSSEWLPIYRGAHRMAQYLKSHNYRGAFVVVAADGGGIYPSSIQKYTDLFDTHRQSQQNRCVSQKDVLELLLHVFEREGLELIPMVELSGPLTRLEQQRWAGQLPSGADLIDIAGNSWPPAGSQAWAPGYNLLSQQVRDEIGAVVAELAANYTEHSSFAGVAIKLGPGCCTQLPGLDWGYDHETMLRFLESQQIDQPAEPTNRNHAGQRPAVAAAADSDSGDKNTKPQLVLERQETVRRLRQGELAEAWQQWRMQTITQFYADVASALPAVRQNTAHTKTIGEHNPVQQDTVQQDPVMGQRLRLYMAAIDIWQDPRSQSRLVPRVHSSPDYKRELSHQGLDLEQISNHAGITILRPHRFETTHSLPARRQEYAYQTRAERDASQIHGAGDLFTFRYDWIHLAQLGKSGILGAKQESLYRLQPVSPAGLENRRRFALALGMNDSQMLVDGGVLLNRGQEKSTQRWLEIYQQIPQGKFEKVAFQLDAEPAIKIRQLRSELDGQPCTFVYAVNTSPWFVDCKIAIAAAAEDIEARGINSAGPGSRPLEFVGLAMESKSDKSSWLRSQLAPFGLAVVQVTAKTGTLPELENYSEQVPETVLVRLQDEISRLKQQLGRMADASPMQSLSNADFEQPRPAGTMALVSSNRTNRAKTIHGWQFDYSKMNEVQTVSDDGANGRRSLRMTSSGNVVWLRSEEFPLPESGRLSVVVSIKSVETGEVPKPEQPPLVRICIDGGQQESQGYYRFAAVGGAGSTAIDSQWRSFVVHFDDLPLDQLDQMRVGVDLMGAGEVQIDDFKIYDSWFDANDRKVLSQMLAAASFRLNRSQSPYECYRILNNYWMAFLREHPRRDSAALQKMAISDSGTEAQGATAWPSSQAGLTDSQKDDSGQATETQTSETQTSETSANERSGILGRLRGRFPQRLFRLR